MPWNLIGSIRGAPGPTGLRGSTWATGPATPAAPGELAGDQYLNSATGETFEWTGSMWASTGNISGPPGEAGAPGARWLTSDGTPTVPGSNPGDFYLDSSIGDVYEWTGSNWEPVGNLAGPAGPAGPPGDPGDLAPVAFTGDASDLTGTVQEEVLPGRLKAESTIIPTLVALDATTAAGFYAVSADASPTGEPGSLLALNNGTVAAQVFTDAVSGRIYTRTLDGTEWSAWERTAFLDVAAWVTELDEQVTTEDDVALEFVVGIK